MAPLIADGICRFTIHGTYAGRPVANVLDMKIDTTGTSTDRNDAILDQAEILLKEWADHVLENVVQQYLATSCSWVDLDSATGSVGEISEVDGLGMPANGGVAEGGMPGNVAFRVNKGGVGARGTRKGRMYLVGVPESVNATATPNTLSAGVIAALNADLDLFQDGIEQDSAIVGVDYSSELHVLHVVGGSYIGSTRVTSLSADTTLSSQRRRLRG